MKSARLPASRLPTSRSRPSTNAGLYVAIAMAWAGEKRMCEHAMLIIMGIDSHVELPGLKSVAMASRTPAGRRPAARPRQENAEDTRSSHRVDSRRANFLEVIRGCRAYCRRKDG